MLPYQDGIKKHRQAGLPRKTCEFPLEMLNMYKVKILYIEEINFVFKRGRYNNPCLAFDIINELSFVRFIEDN